MDNISQLAAMQDNAPDNQTINRLADLPILEYDRIRESEAQRLNVRVSALDTAVNNARRTATTENAPRMMFPPVEPYPDTVDGALLLEEIHTIIRRHIVCNEETSVTATLWIAFTWFIEHVQVAPLAVITAPERRCGKTQLLDLMHRLSRRPLVASNISPAAIFRVIDAHNPTLLIDEADSFLRENEEARGILNSGHTRQSAYVIRVVGDNHDPRQFSTWGAKAIAGIGTLSETLMDRAVVLSLRRKLPHEPVESLRQANPVDFQRLCSMLARYAADYGPIIAAMRPDTPSTLNDRAKDNWEPLLAIAAHAGEDWLQRGQNAAMVLSANEEDNISTSTELLRDIQEVFETHGEEQLSTSTILSALTENELNLWATYNRGRPMSPRQLARQLGEYGIRPETLRFGYYTQKGYRRVWFDDVFNRYLPASAEESVTPSQESENQELPED